MQKSAPPPRSDVAGLLFGHSREGLLEVQVFKSFPETDGAVQSSPQQGAPAAQRDGLNSMVESLIASSRKDPEVSALELVGWYSFRPTGGLHESDVAFHNRYFRQPTEIALILRPEQHPNVLFELYSRSGMTLLSEEEHRWGSLRHATDTTVAGPVDVTMRAKISDDFYLRAYHVGKTLDRSERRDQWIGAVDSVRSMFRSKPKAPRTIGLGLGEPEKNKRSVSPEASAPAMPMARAAAAAAFESVAEKKPEIHRPPPPAVPPSEPPAPRRARERERSSVRDAVSAAPNNIRAGDPPALPAVIKPQRRGAPVPWFSSVIISVVVAGLTFALYLWTFGGGETPRFIRAIFPDTGLGLRVEGQGDRVLLSWNRHNAVVRSAKEGLLHIDDGTQHRDIRLDQAQVANGAVLYRPESGDVSFRLVVHGAEGATVADTMRVLDGTKVQPLQAKNAPLDVSVPTPAASTTSAGAPQFPAGATQPRNPREGISTAPLATRAPARPTIPPYTPPQRSSAPEDHAPLGTSTPTPQILSIPPAGKAAAAAPAADSGTPPSSSRPTQVAAPAPVAPAEPRPQSPTPATQIPAQNAANQTAQAPAAAVPETPRQSDTAKVSNWEDTNLGRSGLAGNSRGVEPSQSKTPAAAIPTQTPAPTSTGAVAGTNTGAIFVPPRPLRQVLPDLRSFGPISATSQVEVAVRVNKKGRVTEAYLVGDAGHVAPRLGRAALNAAKQWTFEPATLHGKTIQSDHTIVFEFRPPGR